jgi:hypothetical protein
MPERSGIIDSQNDSAMAQNNNKLLINDSE